MANKTMRDAIKRSRRNEEFHTIDKRQLSSLGRLEGPLYLEPRSLYDNAIIGWVERATRSGIVCYDVEKIILILVKEGMTEEDAWEHYSYNISGAWVGKGTPAFLHRGKR